MRGVAKSNAVPIGTNRCLSSSRAPRAAPRARGQVVQRRAWVAGRIGGGRGERGEVATGRRSPPAPKRRARTARGERLDMRAGIGAAYELSGRERVGRMRRGCRAPGGRGAGARRAGVPRRPAGRTELSGRSFRGGFARRLKGWGARGLRTLTVSRLVSPFLLRSTIVDEFTGELLPSAAADVKMAAAPASGLELPQHGVDGHEANNYFRPEGQNVGNFISGRSSSRVLAPPGGRTHVQLG